MHLHDIIDLAANVALTLSLVVAVIFGLDQARAARRDRRDHLTLSTLDSFQTREFAELIYFINSREMPKTGKAMRALPAQDQILFMQFGQQMETLGILVAEKFIDIDLVDKTLGSFVTTSWEKYKPVFLDIRQNAPDPFLGEYFQWLAELIERRMRESPRQPFTGA